MSAIEALIKSQVDGDSELWLQVLYRRTGREAIHHLLRVAASLDSLVVGEPQILGQMKDAFEAADAVEAAGPVLGRCFASAFRVARRIRRDTEIGRQKTSISSVAVDYAQQVFDDFRRKELLVGAGKMSDLAARALADLGASVTVTNRTRARAEALAERLGCEVADYEDLVGAMAGADVVISSTGSRLPVLDVNNVGPVQKKRRNRPLVIIDIAVPRDVDPAVGDLPGVFLVDIDDLQKVAAANLGDRKAEAQKAEGLVDEELRKLLEREKSKTVGPTVAALRGRVHGLIQAETDKTLKALGDVPEAHAAAIQKLGHAIANKLLHGPQVALKKNAAQGGDDLDLIEATQVLFDLEMTPEEKNDD